MKRPPPMPHTPKAATGPPWPLVVPSPEATAAAAAKSPEWFRALMGPEMRIANDGLPYTLAGSEWSISAINAA